MSARRPLGSGTSHSANMILVEEQPRHAARDVLRGERRVGEAGSCGLSDGHRPQI